MCISLSASMKRSQMYDTPPRYRPEYAATQPGPRCHAKYRQFFCPGQFYAKPVTLRNAPMQTRTPPLRCRRSASAPCAVPGARQMAVQHGAAHDIKRTVARKSRAPHHPDAANRLRVGKTADAKQRIVRRNAIHCGSRHDRDADTGSDHVADGFQRAALDHMRRFAPLVSCRRAEIKDLIPKTVAGTDH